MWSTLAIAFSHHKNLLHCCCSRLVALQAEIISQMARRQTYNADQKAFNPLLAILQLLSALWPSSDLQEIREVVEVDENNQFVSRSLPAL